MFVTRFERIALIIFDGFLALTAAGGGLALLTGTIAPGVELLQDSPFSSYTIPGLALLLIVGGSASLATLLMFRMPEMGVLASGFTGSMIIIFEIVEVLVIGSDPGVARNLQLLYFTLGLLMVAFSVALWLPKHGLSRHSVQHTT